MPHTLRSDCPSTIVASADASKGWDSTRSTRSMPSAILERSKMADGMLRVLLVESHPLLASALATIVEGQSDLRVCGIARTGAEAVADARLYEADVVVIDFQLPDMSGPAGGAE